jgi:hypothetical protein
VSERRRSAALWGAIGVLSVAVVGLALPILGAARAPLTALGGVALAAGAVAAGVSYAFEERLVRRGR